jgi:hypothetical protein
MQEQIHNIFIDEITYYLYEQCIQKNTYDFTIQVYIVFFVSCQKNIFDNLVCTLFFIFLQNYLIFCRKTLKLRVKKIIIRVHVLWYYW